MLFWGQILTKNFLAYETPNVQIPLGTNQTRSYWLTKALQMGVGSGSDLHLKCMVRSSSAVPNSSADATNVPIQMFKQVLLFKRHQRGHQKGVGASGENIEMVA